jgi:hypothetical protein
MNELQQKLLGRLQLLRQHGPQWVTLINILDAIIAKLNTIEKMEGPVGPKGERGDVGEAIVGPRGEKGDKGDSIVGPRGERGLDGKIGPMGPIGKSGRDGRDGRDGLDGSDGLPATPEEVIKALKKTGIDAKYIKNIPTVTRELPNISLIPSRGGTKTLEVPGAGQDIRKIIFAGSVIERVGDGVARITSQADESTSVTSVTSVTTITSTTGLVVILADATAGSVVVNLPTAVGNTARISVKKTDSSANTVVPTASGAETIDGASTASISKQYESIDLVSNNINWYII